MQATSYILGSELGNSRGCLVKDRQCSAGMAMNNEY